MKRITPVADEDKLLTPGEVAALFRVKTTTVRSWHKTGLISAVRTLGGHRRYRESEVRALLRKVDNGSVTADREAHAEP